MKKFILRVLLLTLLWQISSASAADTPDNAAKIDKLMSQYADCCSFTGTVLVSDHDKVTFKKGYGLANREWNIPNTPEVKFRLGSITKQFTSMLIMQQVAKGTIELDGHLSDYLPYYRQDTGSKVTISQLLSHTSGIPSYTDAPNFFADVSRNPYGVEEFAKKFCSGDLQFEPGTKFHYDNSGYFLLGAILERVTGKTYETLLKESIFVPLGMKDSGYDHHADILANRATGYQQELGGVEKEPAGPKRPLVPDLGETLVNRGVDAAVAQYRELKRTNPHGYNFDEHALNQLGYMLLEKGRNADAIAIFRLNVEEYPKSGNVYHSLAEAYAKDGQKQQAITNYRKSLELDPKNQNAADKLKQLEQK